ncbi:helix-turn-helix domain-containing protein [Anaerosalibacter sp. Marseille-P3206]|uniref:helix-turn-helix domain-containing protein n=1 Tax=Anaerosalibacter sp. Marseille-P3206 TaxID=1871005 RepID=UPI0009867CDD|nr:helix-turn-helix domain-containing protein [Anaerosalibacter sp. Marseille-P3206]
MNNRVLQLRKELELSQEKFGKRLGVTGAGISKIESGDRNLTDQMIKAICREYYVNEEWLLEGKGEMFRTQDDLLKVIADNLGNMDPMEERFLIEYFKLPEEHRKIFMDFLTKIAKE